MPSPELQLVETAAVEQEVWGSCGDPCWNSEVLEDGPTVEQLLKSCSLQEAHAGIPQEGSHARAQEKSGDEGAAETKHYGLTTASTPLLLTGRKQKTVDWTRRVERCLGDARNSYSPALLGVGNKLHQFPFAVSVLPMMFIGEQSPVHFSTFSFSPILLRRCMVELSQPSAQKYHTCTDIHGHTYVLTHTVHEVPFPGCTLFGNETDSLLVAPYSQALTLLYCFRMFNSHIKLFYFCMIALRFSHFKIIKRIACIFFAEKERFPDSFVIFSLILIFIEKFLWHKRSVP